MKISLVVPVFNEEDAIPIFYKTVREFEGLKQHEVEIVFINDGSKDATNVMIGAIPDLSAHHPTAALSVPIKPTYSM